MRRTVYFSAAADHASRIDTAIEAASFKRDEYIKANVGSIGEVCDEDIKLYQWGVGNHLTVIILFSYFEKEKL